MGDDDWLTSGKSQIIEAKLQVVGGVMEDEEGKCRERMESTDLAVAEVIEI